MFAPQVLACNGKMLCGSHDAFAGTPDVLALKGNQPDVAEEVAECFPLPKRSSIKACAISTPSR